MKYNKLFLTAAPENPLCFFPELEKTLPVQRVHTARPVGHGVRKTSASCPSFELLQGERGVKAMPHEPVQETPLGLQLH